MYCGRGVDKQWNCGKAGTMNLQKMGSLMRDMGEPCLSQSPIKVVITVSRVLKPEKWQASFDVDGKVSDFQKTLKSIIFAGVDPSIRPEVWEFLLGCYTPGSTAEQRKQLRTARRERYGDLIKLCQLMHSSIGTGSLAYVVGSKVMDMRTSSKNDWEREEKVKSRQASVDKSSNLESYYDSNNNCTDTSYSYHRDTSADLVSVRGSTDVAAYESSCFVPASDVCKCSSSKQEREADDLQFATETDTEFRSPMTDVLEKNGKYEKECGLHEQKPTIQNNLRVKDDKMHSFQISNNSDLVKESTSSPSNGILLPLNSEIEMVRSDSDEKLWSRNRDIGTETANTLRISDVPGNPLINAIPPQDVSEERVSEWLWNLHRIVVDVVRTDSHLEFYEDTRNLARMSDILAVYAWVDPATGYCQGMSDLLSPFVVLFEDDADAFWCFEMLLRRMRENFQMEGPTGVMKQLEVLWRILELTDREIFLHLSHIGAESLHFAFRMLLVLFRREISFNEALLMWEMMWAADFNETIADNLEKNCLETLVIQLPSQPEVELREESLDNGRGDSKGDSQTKHRIADGHPFCGLTRHFFSRNDHLQIHSAITSTSNGTDGLPVFCVAAILILNRQKIMRETRSFDDMIKIFNDKVLKINVKRCIRTAIKIRKKYFCKLIRRNSPAVQNGD